MSRSVIASRWSSGGQRGSGGRTQNTPVQKGKKIVARCPKERNSEVARNFG